jgi:TolA-binding protein
MSLASLGSVEDACGTFSELLSRYPNAAPSIVRRVQIERQKHSCP